MVVNIDTDRYSVNVANLKDPDLALLQAAADPTRLAILRQLAAADDVCACDFTACCDVSQPTISHHLRVLREAGWVSSERRGTWVWYRLQPAAAERFAAIAGQLVMTPTAGGSAAEPAGRRLPVLQPN